MYRNLLRANFILLILYGTTTFATQDYERPIDWSGNIYKIIDIYNKRHKVFSKTVCRPGDSGQYRKLIRQYRGQGYYLPKLGLEIDRGAIIKNLHHFKKKIKFIGDMVERLKKTKNFPTFALVKNEVDQIVNNLLVLKKQSHLAIRSEDKLRIQKKSRHEMSLLKKQFDIFVDQFFFLKSYNFPNDYLANRREYEKFKDLPEISNKKKANEIFFYRRVTEDGAFDPNRTRADKFIRTALDTLYLKINEKNDFITENIRYDLEWLESKLESIVKRGKSVQLARLREWQGRTQRNFDFYLELISLKNAKKARFLVEKENEASLKLREFVYRRQGETYNFWAKESNLNKALFALETILVHEVGVIDGRFALERRSVAKVVLNRYHNDFYNQLSEGQQISKYISQEINTKKEKWLNTLFKIGEFSFTYHYIPAVAGIFCPDMSRRGRGIRRNNLKIALRTIKSHDGSFRAFRYFSRISMLGKIDMSSVWTGYKRLPEILGHKSSHQKKLISYYYGDKYQYLYSFINKKNVEHSVIKIKNKTYSMRWEKGLPHFFDYRNPHLFAYFSKKN